MIFPSKLKPQSIAMGAEWTGLLHYHQHEPDIN